MTDDRDSPTPARRPGPQPARHGADPDSWQPALVARVVFQTEQHMQFSADGRTPFMTQRQVPTTITTPLTPVDYARILQQWATGMPRTETSTGWVAAIALIAGVLLIVIGETASDSGPVRGFMVTGALSVAIGLITAVAWLRKHDPNTANALAAGLYGYNAVSKYRAGHTFVAGINALGAVQHTQQIHQRNLATAHQQQQDLDYWDHIAAQPLDTQLHAVDDFRQALQQEYSRRVHGRIAPADTPVPSYYDVATHLTNNPIAW